MDGSKVVSGKKVVWIDLELGVGGSLQAPLNDRLWRHHSQP